MSNRISVATRLVGSATLLLAVAGAGFGAVVLAVSNHLQLLALDSPNPQGDARFGLSVDTGDTNGDGYSDVVVSAYREDVLGTPDRGRVYVSSGADGTLLQTLDKPAPESEAWFGESVGVGDIDGDGAADVLVGAPKEDVAGNNAQGRAYAFSGMDGSLLFSLTTPDPQPNEAVFGETVAVGDINGDGKGDMAVAAPGFSQFRGRVYVFSGVDGSLLLTLDHPQAQPNANFGFSVAMGELNGDGRTDLAVAASTQEVAGNTAQGRAFVFSGLDGSLLHTLDTPNFQGNAQFGAQVRMGDVDADGKSDIVVGAVGEDVGTVADLGRVYVFSGADGSLLRTLDNPDPNLGARLFGRGLGMGMVDGDDKEDIVVGAPGSNPTVYVFSGVNGSIMAAIANPGAQSDSGFGDLDNVSPGDMSGGGRDEIAVGAHGEHVGSVQNQGRAYVFGVDQDGDGLIDDVDNCASTSNADQQDSDGDGSGDACDSCPTQPGPATNSGCPTGPPSVGGTVQLLADGSDSPARAADGSGPSVPYATMAGGGAAAALAVAACGWYSKRRRRE